MKKICAFLLVFLFSQQSFASGDTQELSPNSTLLEFLEQHYGARNQDELEWLLEKDWKTIEDLKPTHLQTVLGYVAIAPTIAGFVCNTSPFFSFVEILRKRSIEGVSAFQILFDGIGATSGLTTYYLGMPQTDLNFYLVTVQPLIAILGDVLGLGAYFWVRHFGVRNKGYEST